MSSAKFDLSIIADEFRIAPMTEHDLLEVVEIEEACALSIWGWDAYYAELTQGDASLMWVALEEDFGNKDGNSKSASVVGFIVARLGAGELHINNVAVRQAYRRHGLGRDLLNAVLSEGRRCGARDAWLEVRAGNLSAQALYARCGFIEVGRRTGYYRAPMEDALIMSRPLDEET
jgi:ribosomal-protein-alanine acetyltransferase